MNTFVKAVIIGAVATAASKLILKVSGITKVQLDLADAIMTDCENSVGVDNNTIDAEFVD